MKILERAIEALKEIRVPYYVVADQVALAGAGLRLFDNRKLLLAIRKLKRERGAAEFALADLSGADLSGVNLRGATMPDGSVRP